MLMGRAHEQMLVGRAHEHMLVGRAHENVLMGRIRSMYVRIAILAIFPNQDVPGYPDILI